MYKITVSNLKDSANGASVVEGSLRAALAEAAAYTGGEEVVIEFSPELAGELKFLYNMTLPEGVTLKLAPDVVLNMQSWDFDVDGTLVADWATPGTALLSTSS